MSGVRARLPTGSPEVVTPQREVVIAEPGGSDEELNSSGSS